MQREDAEVGRYGVVGGRGEEYMAEAEGILGIRIYYRRVWVVQTIETKNAENNE